MLPRSELVGKKAEALTNTDFDNSKPLDIFVDKAHPYKLIYNLQTIEAIVSGSDTQISSSAASTCHHRLISVFLSFLLIYIIIYFSIFIFIFIFVKPTQSKLSPKFKCSSLNLQFLGCIKGLQRVIHIL